MARPRKTFPDDIEQQICDLAERQVADHHIADKLGMGETTLRRRFGTALKKGRQGGKAKLQIKQYDMAMNGNVTMLIWLGKQYLGQSEPMTQLPKAVHEVILKYNLDKPNKISEPPITDNQIIEETNGRDSENK